MECLCFSDLSYIQETLGVGGGVALQKLGSIYKTLAKKAMPNETDSQKLTDEAQKFFDKEGKTSARKKYDELVDQMKKTQLEKKETREADKTKAKADKKKGIVSSDNDD